MYFNYLPVGNWHGQKKATKWNASAGTPRWGHHLTMISQFIPLKSLISLYLSSSLISSHYQSYIICKPILTSHDIIHIYIYREREWYSMYVCIYIHCYTLYYTVSILYHILSTVYLSPIWYMSQWSFFLTQLDIPMTSDSLDWRQFHCSSLGRSLQPAGIGPGNTAGLEKHWINKQWIHKGN